MPRSLQSIGFALLAAVVLATGATPAAAEGATTPERKAARPVLLLSHRDHVRTKKGLVCPRGAGCPGTRYRSRLHPRLRIRAGARLAIRLRVAAKSLYVSVDRPSHNGTAPHAVKEGRASRRCKRCARRFVFTMPRRAARRISTATLVADYGKFSATYQAGLRVVPGCR